MAISDTPILEITITPTALNVAKLIEPVGGATQGWVSHEFQGTGLYALCIDTSAMAGSDAITIQGLNQLLPGGTPEIEFSDVRATPPGLDLIQEDALLVQYGAQWQLIQTAGTLRSYPCVIYRIDTGVPGPVAKGTIQPPNTSTNNSLTTISTPGIYLLSASVKNMLAGDTVSIWETTSVLTSSTQQNPSNNVPAGAPAAGTPTILKNDVLLVGPGRSATFFLKQTALGTGHGGVFPTFDWRLDQVG